MTEDGNEQACGSISPDLPDSDVADHARPGGVLRTYHVLPCHMSVSMLPMSTPTTASL